MAVHHSFDPKSIPTNHQHKLVQINKMQLSFVQSTSVNNTCINLLAKHIVQRSCTKITLYCTMSTVEARIYMCKVLHVHVPLSFLIFF